MTDWRYRLGCDVDPRPVGPKLVANHVTVDTYLWVLSSMGGHLLHLLLCPLESLGHGLIAPDTIKEVTGEGGGAHDHGLLIRTGAGDNGTVGR